MTEDAATAFLRAVRGTFASFGGLFRLQELVSRRWASVTFSGARHRLVFTLEGPGAVDAADAFLRTVGDAEFELRDHILADISPVAAERSEDGEQVRISVEALTVEDG